MKSNFAKLTEIKEKFPELTFDNDGYQYISQDIKERNAAAIIEISAILKQEFSNFVTFNNFKPRKDGTFSIRVQCKYDESFVGVAYIKESEFAETVPFYKIENPTTAQIFDAIIEKDYIPIEKMMHKAKQIRVLLTNYFGTDELLVTFDNVTNSGGCPIFYTSSDSLFEVADGTNKEFATLSNNEQDEIIELLGCYSRTYNEVFNLSN